MYVVVKKVGKKVVDETKFDSLKKANDFADFARHTVRPNVKYEVEERN